MLKRVSKSQLKRVLDIEEIKLVDEYFEEYLDDFSKLKEKFLKINKKDENSIFQKPKIPPLLSECAVIFLIREKRLEKCIDVQDVDRGVNVKRSRWIDSETEKNERSPDIVIMDKNNKIKKIEVKATGAQGFNKISKKDARADFFIWLDYSNYFLKENPHLNVYIFNDVKRRDKGIKLQQLLERRKHQKFVFKRDKNVKIPIQNYLTEDNLR